MKDDAKSTWIRNSVWVNHSGALLAVFSVAMLATLFSELFRLLSDQYQMKVLNPVAVSFFTGIALSPWFQRNEKLKLSLQKSFRIILQTGVVLVGFQLSLSESLRIGLGGLPILGLAVVLAGGMNLFLGRLLRVPSLLKILVVVGTSICGVSAILAASSALRPKQEDLNRAIITIILFGSAAFLSYPYLAHMLFESDEWSVGLLLGAAIHDTAQVASAALMHQQVYNSETVLEIATVTKMLRNLGIIFLIPLIAILKGRADELNAKPGRYIPTFLFLFLLAALVRTWGDWNSNLAFGVFPAAQWWNFLEIAEAVSAFLLTMATAALGLTFQASVLLRMGWRTFAFGFICAFNVGLVTALLLAIGS